MKKIMMLLTFAIFMFTGTSSFANSSVKDISYSDKYCCCKAGCPSGWSGYACRAFCFALGGSCSRKASSFPDGADPGLRNSCMGASFSWWSGITCPKTCKAGN